MARVLMINDEPDLLEMCQIVLESGGHSVRTVTAPSRAAEIAADYRPDVVFLDLIMPELSGEAVMERLRSDEATAKIPVIVMSALADAEERAEKMGADGFMGKPFDPGGLLSAVDRAVSGAPVHRMGNARRESTSSR